MALRHKFAVGSWVIAVVLALFLASCGYFQRPEVVMPQGTTTIVALTELTAPASGDDLIINDVSASNATKRIDVGNLYTDVDLDIGTGDFTVGGASDLGGNISSSVGAVTVTDSMNVTDTATFSKGSGNAIVVSAGGTLEMPATADISLDGYMNVGDGTPDGSVTAGTDEQLYVEGAFEVDGEAEFDGAIDADSTADFGGVVTCSYAGNCLTSGTTADIEWLGFAAFGDATPDGVTDGTAEDVYVEGGLEVDGVIYADGAIDADSTADFADTVTFSKGSGIAATVSAGGVVSFPATADLYAYGYAAVGDGTPDGSVSAGTDEELYVEGDFEVDGEAEFDGAIDADGTADFADTVTFSKASAGAIVVSAGGTVSLPATSDLYAYGYVAVGDGTPDGDVTAGTDEQLYVEGALEVDGTLNADGPINADSTLNVDSNTTLQGAADIYGNISSSVGAVTVTDSLHIYAGASGNSNTDAHTRLTLEKDDSIRLQFLSPNDKENTILFGDEDSIYAGGRVSYDHSDNTLGLWTSGNERMLIDSSGVVHIDSTLHVTGSLNVTDTAVLYSTLDVRGNISDGAGDVTVDDAFNVTGAADLDSSLNVDGDTTLVGDADVAGQVTAQASVFVHASQVFTYEIGAGGSATLLTIPDGDVYAVLSIWIETTTDWTTTAGDDEAVIIGDDADTDGFLAAADTELKTTFTEATGYAAGYYGIENGSGGAYTLDDGGPFIYAPSGAAQTVDIAWSATGDDLTDGAATAHILYMVISE